MWKFRTAELRRASPVQTRMNPDATGLAFLILIRHGSAQRIRRLLDHSTSGDFICAFLMALSRSAELQIIDASQLNVIEAFSKSDILCLHASYTSK